MSTFFRWPHFQDVQQMVVPGAPSHANSRGSDKNGSSPWEFSNRSNHTIHTHSTNTVKIAGGVYAVIFCHLTLQGDKG